MLCSKVTYFLLSRAKPVVTVDHLLGKSTGEKWKLKQKNLRLDLPPHRICFNTPLHLFSEAPLLAVEILRLPLI